MNFYTNIQLVGNTILYRGYEGGEKVAHRDSFSPTLFVSSKKNTKYKTLDGKSVKPIRFESVRDARDFVKRYDDVEDFDVLGYERFLYQYISDKYPQDELKFDMSVMNIISLDIEVQSENGFPDVESAAEKLLCITVKDFNTKKFITWGVREYDNKRDDVEFIWCKDEQNLLLRFLQYWVENTPDVVTGWNVYLYDIPYLARRIDRVLSEKHKKSLSPWNLIQEKEIYIQGRKNLAYDIAGVSCLDYLDLYRKFTYSNQESYRLDHIAMVELGEKKLDHSEYENFKDFYTQDWQKFVDYNIHDVELVDRMEDKMRLIELCLTMAYDARQNYEDVYSQVKTWDNIIFNFLRKKDIVVPPKTTHKKESAYAGAYVKEPKAGRYDWVVSFDLNSLYPHLIMQYNISPETLWETRHPDTSVEGILNQKVDIDGKFAVCTNGAQYRKDLKGFLPKLMENMYNDRVIFKKKMIQAKKDYEKTPTKALEKEIARCNNIQMAKKISLNSAYGAIGNEYFRYFKLANAEAITLSGQVSIRWIENKMNAYLNKLMKTEEVDYVIASDTDSIYLNLGDLVETVYKGREKTTEGVVRFLDQVCETKLEPYIESSYEELAGYVNAYDQKMQMKRENIAERGIWTAKKRYILNVWNSEGVQYNEPKLKMMGIEAVKSSTPAPCRTMIKDALKLMMNGTEDDVIDYIEKSRTHFKSLPPEDISFPRSASRVDKYSAVNSIYAKGTPIHIRGALLFNYYVKKNKLDNKYSLINNGEKVKFCYLKLPNPIHENVMSFIQEFPKELELNNYVDYDLQFEKSFLEPLKAILNAIGWNVEKTATLEAFFN